MRGCHGVLAEHPVGHRVVTARGAARDLQGRTTYAGMRIERITWIDQDAVAQGHNARARLSGADGERELIMCRSSWAETGEWRVVWSDGMPADDGEALAFVAAVLGREDRAFMAWVAATAQGVALVHQVWDGFRADREMASTRLGTLWLSANPIRVENGDGALAENDVVIARHVDCRFEEPFMMHVLGDVVRVGNLPVADLPTFYPIEAPRREALGWGNLTGPSVVEDAEIVAWARTEPSQALVAITEDGGYGAVHVMHKQGVDFLHQDDAAAYLEQSAPGPGLWMFVDAKASAWQDHEGGWDASIDGDWRPATTVDLDGLFANLDVADREIAETCDIPQDGEAGLATRMMEQAAATAAAEEASTIID